MWKAPFFSTIHPITCSFHRLLIITVIISLNHFAFFIHAPSLQRRCSCYEQRCLCEGGRVTWRQEKRLYECRSWIHTTEIRWCQQSFHSISLIGLTMRTPRHPAIYYETICKTISRFIYIILKTHNPFGQAVLIKIYTHVISLLIIVVCCFFVVWLKG